MKRKFNIVDVVLLLLVAAAGVGVLALRDRSTGADVKRETSPMRYTVEITMAPPDMENLIHVGDDVYRSSDNVYLGKLVDFKSVVHQEYGYLVTVGEFRRIESPDYRDMYLTIENEGYSTPRDIVVGSVTPKICGEMYVKGKGYAKMGYVFGIDTMGAALTENTDEGTGGLEAVYVLKFADMREPLLEGLHVGDKLYESVTGSMLGTIQDIWTEPYGETHFDAEGNAVYAEKDNSSNVFVRLSGRAVDQADGYYLDGGTELKVGAAIVAQSQYISRMASFYALERIGEA